MISNKHEKKLFFIRIILPTFLAFCLFTITFFFVIIPHFENQMLDRKREMISELTNSAWSILEEYNLMERNKLLSVDEAKAKAVEVIKNLRYGAENKDYFWITDMHPNMIMHPYREELDQSDLTNYQDPDGKKLFVEFVKIVKNNGKGYVDYMWQWKDDSTRIVPKLSYVKGFEPWGWIIGTGIYIEDVKTEIANLSGNLLYISIIILVLLGSLLFFVTQQSLKIESAKQDAEESLRDSEAKYRALVEAATEGLVMMLNNEFVYANKTMLKMLGTEDDEFNSNKISQLLCREGETTGAEYFSKLTRGEIPQNQFEAEIKDAQNNSLQVLLTASPISFGEKTGYTIIVKDISTNKQIREELGETEERYKLITNNIRIGIFRTTPDHKSKFIQLNPAAVELMGCSSGEELLDTSFIELFHNSEEKKTFLEILHTSGSVKNYVASFNQKNRSIIKLSISAVFVNDENNNPVYCDGILEDVSERLRMEEERENLIVELQTSLHFLNEPINRFLKHIISCDLNTPVHDAAELMTKKKYSAILITSNENEYIGIVTDRDLRERAVASSFDTYRPVYHVMTSPIVSINDNATVFEAFLTMFEKSTRHLAVKNADGQIISMISSEELLQVQIHSSSFLIKEIESADIDDIPRLRKRLQMIVKAMVDSGAKPKSITRTITSVTDIIMKRNIEAVISEQGEPPVPFSFIALGSQGREEQTLFTDQDNALIYDDTNFAPTRDTEIYFHNLAVKVCNSLNDSGYHFCNGDSMAKNPKWCQPLSKWKEYYKSWIVNSNPQDLLELSIFFDFRNISGNNKLENTLREFLFKTSEGQSGFFQHLTRNCLMHKPPVGILGNIVFESKGDHPETFNIKNAIMPLTDFARILALKNKIPETNTIERIAKLYSMEVVNKNSYEEFIQAYNFLMQLRLKHQVKTSEGALHLDNAISPNELTQIELKTLKNIFTQITAIQRRLSSEFTGETL